jgi:hypothetical protein
MTTFNPSYLSSGLFYVTQNPTINVEFLTSVPTNYGTAGALSIAIISGRGRRFAAAPTASTAAAAAAAATTPCWPAQAMTSSSVARAAMSD